MRARFSASLDIVAGFGGVSARAGVGLVLLFLGAALVRPEAASAQSDSTATLLWVAPGDDGSAGRASRYELRYRTTAIAGTDTLTWWNAAIAVSGLPTPGASGSTDSVVVQRLDPSQAYYFIVRAADEAFNWSGFSNLAIRNRLTDTTPPAAITDLAATASAGPAAPGGGESARKAPPVPSSAP